MAPDARILIVDDNEMNLEVILDLLKETRIKVSLATSGEGCIESVRKARYDLILLDQMMPGLSGTQVLKQIRDEHLADGTPIIALTADAIVGARDNYISEGFTDYLSKPVMYKELERVLLVNIDPSLLRSEEEISRAGKKTEEELPVVLVVSDNAEKLNEMKELLKDRYKGVFVRDEDKAEKFLKKHRAEFVIRTR